MNETLYRLGLGLIRLAIRIPPLASALGLFSRVWERHHKVYIHLRAFKFDGVIDGGANIGEFAGLVKAALPETDLVCVEPHPASAAYLRAHGYRVVEAALWSEPARLRLTQPSGASTSCTVLDASPSAAEGKGAWMVDAVRLDSLEIKGAKILIKLDLQGAEKFALEGMGALWDRTAAFLLEMPIGPDKPAAKLEELLLARGYFAYSTTNEFFDQDRVLEADKLWLRRDFFEESTR